MSMGVPEPQAKAYTEAIAAQMDIFARVLGEGAPQPTGMAPPRPQAQPAAFPSLNPESVAMAHGLGAEQGPHEPLIITDTRMPSPAERATAPPPAAPAYTVQARPGERLKVEELSQILQDRTPPRLIFDVPMQDGTVRRTSFVRNVISQHAYDSVQLTYYPPNALPSAREATEVCVVLHVDEAPFDLAQILARLKAQAIESVRPRGAPRELPVRPFSGPVTHASDESQVNEDFAPQAAQLSSTTQAIFKSLG